MAKFLVGGRLIHSHFLLSPFIKPAWCGEISLYSDLEPNNNPTKVESTGKMKNGNENKSYDDSVKLLRTEMDPFRLG